jgi:acetyltransferase
MEPDNIAPELPPNYPVDWVSTATLENGAVVVVRPIRPDDAPRIQHGLTHLSAETIYYRFLDATNQFTEEQALRLASLDYFHQMALVATVMEAGEEHLVGVARYAMVGAEAPGVAENAVVVRDDYQRLGLGTVLLERLFRYASQHGVTTFTASILQSNARIMNFIRRSGLPFERKMLEPGVFQVNIHLDAIGDEDRPE